MPGEPHRLLRTVEVLAELLRGFAFLYGPTAIALEDCQHADSGSWDLISRAGIPVSPPAPLLVVVTARPGEGNLLGVDGKASGHPLR